MSLEKVDYAASTALVTGGTSGIGRAIAQELVKRGVPRIALVARSEENLATTAKDMKAISSEVDVFTIKADLSDHDGPANVQNQVREKGWSIDILVNNAGFGRKFVFAQDPENDPSVKSVDLMVRAVVDMSLRFLPDMVKKGKGGILNVGSTGGFQPVPYTASYAASKAFVMNFSQAIREEQRVTETGVRIACVVPGITDTNLNGEGEGETRGPVISKVGIDQPEDVAKVAVDAFDDNAAARTVGWNNTIFHAVQGVLPQSTIAKIVSSARGPPDHDPVPA